jgi:hypothetical protein
MIPLDLGDSNLTSLSNTPRLVRPILFQQLETVQRAQSAKCFGSFVAYHLALESIGVYEDFFQVRDSGGTADLAEYVGEFVLQ